VNWEGKRNNFKRTYEELDRISSAVVVVMNTRRFTNSFMGTAGDAIF